MEKNLFLLPNDLKEQLERIVRSHKSQVRLMNRARIILSALSGKNNCQIARELKCSIPTVRKWIKRLHDDPRVEALDDASRTGRPLKIPACAKCEVMKTACSPCPAETGGNLWTIKSLQSAVAKATGIKVSRSEIHRILNHTDLKPHKVKMWLHSPDPKFREKVTQIASLYLTPPENGVVLCVDEKTGMQAIERRKSIASMEKKGQVRIDQEYKRHGTQTLIAALNIENGEVFAQCGKTRKKEDIAVFMEKIAEKYPDEQVYIVWDNLNIHHGYTWWWEFNKRHGDRFHFIYTPIHASWVNQIEIWFGILQRKALRHASFKSEEDLRDKVLSFVAWWNEKEAHPFKWQYRGYVEAA